MKCTVEKRFTFEFDAEEALALRAFFAEALTPRPRITGVDTALAFELSLKRAIQGVAVVDSVHRVKVEPIE